MGEGGAKWVRVEQTGSLKQSFLEEPSLPEAFV